MQCTNPYYPAIIGAGLSIDEMSCLIVMADYGYRNGGLGLRVDTTTMMARTGLDMPTIFKAMNRAWKRGLLSRDGCIYGQPVDDCIDFTLNITAVKRLAGGAA